MADNQVGGVLFEFQDQRMTRSKTRDYEGFFHICLLSDNIEKLADKIANTAGKSEATYRIHGKTSLIT
ncbi:hypothetical protein ACWF7H_23475 [Peribacillus butanolivorans]